MARAFKILFVLFIAFIGFQMFSGLLALASIQGFHGFHPTMDGSTIKHIMHPWGGIALIICAVALLHYVKGHTKKSGVSNSRAADIEQRLSELERRLVDVQDIMLSIDEKLERQEKEKLGG